MYKCWSKCIMDTHSCWDNEGACHLQSKAVRTPTKIPSVLLCSTKVGAVWPCTLECWGGMIPFYVQLLLLLLFSQYILNPSSTLKCVNTRSSMFPTFCVGFCHGLGGGHSLTIPCCESPRTDFPKSRWEMFSLNCSFTSSWNTFFRMGGY